MLAASLPTLHREARLLLEPASTSQGEITERRSLTCRSKSSTYTCYDIDYVYYAGDVAYTGVYRDNSPASVVGSPYPVTRLNSAPSVHHVGGRGIMLDSVWIILLMGLMIVLIGAVPIISLLFEYRSFLREGEWAEGELSSVSRAVVKRGKNAEYQLSVRYRYTDPFSQQDAQGGQKAARNDLRRQTLLPLKDAPALVLVKSYGASKML